MDAAISRLDIAQTLSKIREISGKSHVFGETKIMSPQSTSFDKLLSLAKESIQSVNSTQVHSETVQSMYLTGDKQNSIADVMMATMKSKVALEGLIVVRNKLLEAYKEIMSIQA